jgi:hypothetical protein
MEILKSMISEVLYKSDIFFFAINNIDLLNTEV